MPLAVIPLLLLGVPILEIAVFIALGGAIGLWSTLLMIFVTAVIGTALLRQQGIGLMRQVQQETDAGRVPGEALSHGAMILVAGVLLLTPGFVTDTLGFLLFVPRLRTALWTLIRSRITVHAMGTSRAWFHQGSRSGTGSDRGSGKRGPVVDLDDAEWNETTAPSASPSPASNLSSPWHDKPGP